MISEFARACGVSPRSLRHYEEAGLLVPERTSSGYRDYCAADLATVARIRLLLDAGLSATATRRYLDCVAQGDNGLTVEMCPDLRQALLAVEECLAHRSARIARTRDGLSRISRLSGLPSPLPAALKSCR